MSVSVAVNDACGTLGDGLYWETNSQTLLYVDWYSGDRHRWNPVTGQDDVRHIDGTAPFIIPNASGGYVSGRVRSLIQVDWLTGDIVEQYGEVQRGSTNYLNDGKCDASGRLWTGTLTPSSVGLPEPDTEPAGLFSFDGNGSIHQHLSGLVLSNGLAWSPDNRTMYLADSVPGKVYTMDFDLDSGSVANQRTAITLDPEMRGSPDGMCSDTDGKLWIACFGTGKVIRFDPNTGKEMQILDFPVKYVTSCCFGGKNNDELYVTSSRKSLTDDEMRAQPLAGSIFKVTGLGVKGQLVSNYKPTPKSTNISREND